MRLVHSILAFVFPPSCLACGVPMEYSPERVCEKCWRTIKAVVRSDAVYQRAFAMMSHDGLVDELVVPFYFEKDGALQTLLHLLKYGGIPAAGEVLGRKLGAHALRSGAWQGHVLLPVPLHRAKERERGYNQAEYIARAMGKQIGMETKNGVLRRVAYTKTQTALGFEERQKNVRGAFALTRRGCASVKGASIILVDDVVTTGATSRECAQVLKAAGAERIVVSAVALAE